MGSRRAWAALAAALTIALVIVSAGTFSTAGNVDELTADATIQLRAEQVLGAVTVTRSLVSEALVVAAIRSVADVPEQELTELLNEARDALDEVWLRADRLDTAFGEAGDDGYDTVPSLVFVETGRAIVALIEGGEDPADIDTAPFVSSADGVASEMTGIRDARERDIAAARLGIESVARTSRFLVAVTFPFIIALMTTVLGRLSAARRELRLRLEHEHELGAVRDRFIASVSHRLRTPLTAVVGFASSLHEQRHELTAAERNEFIELLVQQASTLHDVVDDLLALERLDAGAIVIEPEPTDLRAHANRVAARWAESGRRPIAVSGSGAGLVDRIRFDQALRAVLNNAADHGGPRVRIEVGTAEDSAYVDVIDDGDGFPPGVDPFSRYAVAEFDTNQPAPLGLGLAVARLLLTAMGGSVSTFRRNDETFVRLSCPRSTDHTEEVVPPAPTTTFGTRPTIEDVRRAIEGSDFEVVLQPIASVSTGETVGYESLSRFESGSPIDWFEAAAGHDLGVDLELAAIAQASEAFSAAGLDGFLAVNVSTQTLCSPQLVDCLDPVALDRVVVELKEDAAIATYDGLLHRVEALRRLGLRLAVDDMGTAERDLWHITRLVPDFLKLDRSLIADVDRDPSKLAVVESLCVLAHRLGGQVVAEGIERSEELDRIAELGVDLAQGYLLGRPEPVRHESPRQPVAKASRG